MSPTTCEKLYTFKKLQRKIAKIYNGIFIQIKFLATT